MLTADIKVQIMQQYFTIGMRSYYNIDRKFVCILMLLNLDLLLNVRVHK